MQRRIFTQAHFYPDDFLYHFFFWIVLFALHFHNFIYSNAKFLTSEWEIGFVDAFFTALATIISTIAASYLHTYRLLSWTLGNEKMALWEASLLYVTSAILLAVFSSFCFQLLFDFQIFITLDKTILHNWQRNFPESFFNMYLLTGLVYIRKWFNNSEMKKLNEKMEEIENEAEMYKYDAKESKRELLNWKFQPHFMFNALKNIHYKSLKEPSVVPELIMKFSELFAYVTYDCSKPNMDIEDEFKCIEDYIALAQIGLEDKYCEIEIKIEENSFPKKQKIAPLILMPIIENGVKYGLIQSNLHKKLKLHIFYEENYLILEMLNSQPTEKNTRIEKGGEGFVNLISRLKIEYPEKYTFEHGNKMPDVYKTSLKIQLN